MTGPSDGGGGGGAEDRSGRPRGFPLIPAPRPAGDDMDPPPHLDRLPEPHPRDAQDTEERGGAAAPEWPGDPDEPHGAGELEVPDEWVGTDERDGAGELDAPSDGPACSDVPAWSDEPDAPDDGPDAPDSPDGPGARPDDHYPADRAVETSGPAAMRPRPLAYGPWADAGHVPPAPLPPSHKVLKSLLGAWALAACSAEESVFVEDHLTECAPCAEEAQRLRDAVGLLHADHTLDLDPLLRSRVLDNCLSRRPARIAVPEWANPYDAETARLDALLRDMGDAEWHTPVRLKWFENEKMTSRKTTVAGVVGHLMIVDGLVSAALGLDDPLGAQAPAGPAGRTESFWRAAALPATGTVREPWREQSHTLVRTVSFASPSTAELPVSYGGFALPLRHALLDRAFECWIHGADIAKAVHYPYRPPASAHLHQMIDLAAQTLPSALAGRRQAGLAAPVREPVEPGRPGRSLRLEIEGPGGGDWYIALDDPAAAGSPDRAVAQLALDGVEFCQLVAGHVSPEDAVAGQDGDREAIRDVLFAAAAMSRL
ncbi:maleylpyruvate isomerase N-terminal domain-containing protein [Streptomyces sp. NPDC088725]|uniref:maleylpyruvate isomerase N-terminal domain-containing protein n=1 Tax=Streptomyces sp. NPDC088725 TaxID=3365873 RepID=UPI0037F227D5